MNTTVESRWHFGIPILDTYLPNFQEHQNSLIHAFKELREQDSPDLHRSNQGGWHSADNLHISKNPDIHWLTQTILNLATQTIQQFEGESFTGRVGLTGLWVNINKAGNWNMPHNHLPNEWSGVAYIAVNDKAQDKQNDRSGDLIFINPLPMNQQYKRAPTISYTPQSGKMFLFPGYLLHMVAPHNDNEERVSVAFNFKLQEGPN
jgi:uncharacterized protein (TIGR02466 family)